MRILVVDDHRETCAVLRRLLTLDGHAIEWAHTAGEAATRASATCPDLLLTDINLPDGSGIDLLRDLRSRCELQGVVLTGHGEASLARACEAAGFHAVRVEPVAYDRQAAAVRAAGGAGGVP